MRKILYATFVLLIGFMMLMLAACSNEGNTFKATVLDNNETTLLVEPDADTTEAKSADKISVSVKDAAILDSNDNEILIEDFKVGSKLEISYRGGIAESYPAQLQKTYKIKLLD